MPARQRELKRKHLDAVRRAIALEGLGDQTIKERIQRFLDEFDRINALEEHLGRRQEVLLLESVDDEVPDEEIVELIRTQLVLSLPVTTVTPGSSGIT